MEKKSQTKKIVAVRQQQRIYIKKKQEKKYNFTGLNFNLKKLVFWLLFI